MKCQTVLVAMSLAALAACSDRDAAQEVADAAEQARAKVEQAMPQKTSQDDAESSGRAGPALPEGDKSVAAAELKALLPEEFAGLQRVSQEAERAGAGVRVSKARAEYGAGDQRASVMITDLGGFSSLAQMGMQLFDTEVDNVDDKGFERTTRYKGHPSYQRMMKIEDNSIAEIMVFVDDRFTVQIDAQNLDWETMLKAVDEVDLQRLQSLRQASK